MNTAIGVLVQKIHDQPGRVVLVTAGAGSQALVWLLGVAGASRTLLEALIPYDWASFDDFLGQKPQQYVAIDTAYLMAGRALTRARWLHQEEMVLGLACTATIATDRPKRGAHRAHVAVWQPHRIAGCQLVLEKGARDRQGEEEVVSRLMLNVLAEAFGLEPALPLQLGDGDSLEQSRQYLDDWARHLDAGDIPFFLIRADGRATTKEVPPLLLPGSFSPLHEGHLGLARTAQAYTGQALAFEIAARNVDKLPLAPAPLLERMAAFAGRWPVVASSAATFEEKARLFPGTTFIVGYDTALRILDPCYYDDSPKQMLAALATIQKHGCRFLVAGRIDGKGKFHPPGTLETPAGYGSLFHPLHDFRRDISSTELRARGARGSR